MSPKDSGPWRGGSLLPCPSLSTYPSHPTHVQTQTQIYACLGKHKYAHKLLDWGWKDIEGRRAGEGGDDDDDGGGDDGDDGGGDEGDE